MINTLHLALKALLHNRLQALLTLCGMSVGVAMVVVVSGLGRGAQLSIEEQIESAGPTLITLQAGNFTPAAIITNGMQDSSGGEPSEGIAGGEDQLWRDLSDDAAVASVRERARQVRRTLHRSPAWPLGPREHALLRDFPGVRAVSASVAGNFTLDPDSVPPLRIARLAGFEAAAPEMQGWRLLAGRLPSASEQAEGAALFLVTQSVATRLWPEREALGQRLRLGGRELRLIGVLADESVAGGSAVVPSLHLPLRLAQSLLGREDFDSIQLRSQSVAVTTQLAQGLRQALRELRELPEDTLDDFRVQTQSVAALPSLGSDPRLARAVHANVLEFEQEAWQEMARSLRQAGRTFTLLLASAAAVSLLVGGIGIMNIMLVSVAARTREIGLRMALGARMNDVLRQFMVEAVTLAALGGLLGLALGALALSGARYGLRWATALSPGLLLAALVMAAATGLLFGYGPARRAAGLDPVVALKAE